MTLKNPSHLSLLVASSLMALALNAGSALAQDAAADAANEAYALLRQDQPSAAALAAGRAVAAEPGNLDYRLLLADALLRASRPAEARDALAPVADVSDYRVQTRLAQAAEGAGAKAEAADAYGRAAPLADTAQSRAYLTRARLMALVELGRIAEARDGFDQAWRDGVLQGQAALDTAMLAVAVGNDAVAQSLFQEADRSAPISGRTALDAGYSAGRLGRDADAVVWFRRGLDSAERGEITLNPQQTHDIRREIQTLERRWGTTATISQGGSTVDSAVSAGQPITQAGIEAYRRLGGYNNGRPLDLFARAYGVVDADAPWATGGDTVQGWVGLRWKPFGQTNLVLEASRMIAIGDLARDDTMLRAAWSAETGGDLRQDRSSWPAWRFYADAARILEDEQTLGAAEARAGWAWRVGEGSIITPSLSLRAYHDSALADKNAWTAGPVVNWRTWFRSGRYSAPASYVDLWLGYDFGLSGDDRGEGFRLGLSVSY